mmetsp:Transcript_12086/g.30972  ORF Transcript_12086/g.30972 Transcript_12086/m.30972 type:complete len:98 (-) Transcript_12086:113-406(-)
MARAAAAASAASDCAMVLSTGSVETGWPAEYGALSLPTGICAGAHPITASGIASPALRGVTSSITAGLGLIFDRLRGRRPPLIIGWAHPIMCIGSMP